MSELRCAAQSETELRRSELRRFKSKTSINISVAERSETEHRPSSEYLDYRFPSGYVSFIDFMLI